MFRRVALSAVIISSFSVRQRLQRLVVGLYDLALRLTFHDTLYS